MFGDGCQNMGVPGTPFKDGSGLVTKAGHRKNPDRCTVNIQLDVYQLFYGRVSR
jgi:hypothetical protein